MLLNTPNHRASICSVCKRYIHTQHKKLIQCGERYIRWKIMIHLTYGESMDVLEVIRRLVLSQKQATHPSNIVHKSANANLLQWWHL